MRLLVVSLAIVLPFQWQPEATVSRASLRGIHAISDSVAWAGGTSGTVLRFENGAWKACSVPSDAAKLDFRSVWAWSSQRAIVMSSGPGDSSRLYLTEDGCENWTLLASNQEKDGFWDGLFFVDERKGFLLGDPVNGRFGLLSTGDGGRTWQPDESSALRAEPLGEGAFAASNSSLTVTSGGDLFFGTGGKGGARIFHRKGKVWAAIQVPLGSSIESAGVFSIAFRDARHGVAVGGDFKQPQQGASAAIWTDDEGTSWHLARMGPGGYRSSVAWSAALQAWIAVGPSGTDISHDDGANWAAVDKGNWNAMSLPWVCGPNGSLGRLSTAR